jgi:hypothetical protein
MECLYGGKKELESVSLKRPVDLKGIRGPFISSAQIVMHVSLF